METHNTNTWFLPKELWIDVFIGVPVLGLLLLRCVAKRLSGFSAAVECCLKNKKRLLFIEAGCNFNDYTPSLNVFLFNWETMRWDDNVLPPLTMSDPEKRTRFTGCNVTEDKVIIVGGILQKKPGCIEHPDIITYATNCWVLCCKTRIWEKGPVLSDNIRRARNSCLSSKGSLFIKGLSTLNSRMSTIECMLSGSSFFSPPIPPMLCEDKYDYSCMVPLSDGRIFVAGVYNSAVAQIYDPIGNIWNRVPDMPDIAFEPFRKACSLFVKNQEFVVMFGESYLVYNVENYTWEILPPSPRRHASLWVIGESTVLLSGGLDVEADSVELFDLSTRSWRPVPQLKLPNENMNHLTAQVLI